MSTSNLNNNWAYTVIINKYLIKIISNTNENQ